jgi:hypothetical protein
VITAKGIKPILTLKSPSQRNRIITDIFEIGGIECLRVRRNFKEAISLAYTHADFQGKRICALLIKEGLSESQKIQIEKICGKRNPPNRVGKWSFSCLISVLYELKEISKDEADCLNKLRKTRNSLEHQSVSQYLIDVEKTGALLQIVIQVLLRMRELPVGDSVSITGYEMSQFWADLGFGGYSPRTINRKDKLHPFIIRMPDPKEQIKRDADRIGKWGLGCPGLCGCFWEFIPTSDLIGFEPVDSSLKDALKWVINQDGTKQFFCYDCGVKIKLVPF